MSDYLNSLSCTECGDTIATYRDVPPHGTVWCGRQHCFFRMMEWRPSAQLESVEITGGFRVLREVSRPATNSVAATPAEPAQAIQPKAQERERGSLLEGFRLLVSRRTLEA
jgi:hypothetical protein